MKRRKRRSFSPEYKAEVASLVIDQGRTVSGVCRELDLSPSAVRGWVAQARVDRGTGVPDALTTEEREELRRLRRENRQLRQEREILKKAAAFFAKESR